MSSFWQRLNGNALYALSESVRRTSRFTVQGFEHFEHARDSGRPLIFVAWHGMTMMLAGFFLRRMDIQRMVLMMPDDWRGEALAHWTNKLQAKPFPMNLHGDATMATARALARMVRLLRSGDMVYITPDGPDGPAYAIKPGVAFLAQKAGALLVPVAGYARHGYRLPRWDTYTVPYPFSRIAVAIGPALPAPKDVPRESLLESLTDALHRISASARASYYERT